jgi:hypothetical protein
MVWRAFKRLETDPPDASYLTIERSGKTRSPQLPGGEQKTIFFS